MRKVREETITVRDQRGEKNPLKSNEAGSKKCSKIMRIESDINMNEWH
jgi:hypothetical protein